MASGCVTSIKQYRETAMKLSKVHVKNFRTLENVTVEFN
jgi:hypothetical protein